MTWTYKWEKGSQFPRVSVWNERGIWLATVKGVRARTLFDRLKAGIPLARAIKGIL